MISIQVISFKQTASAPLGAVFDERGGTIGRAADNRLVLPDPEQTISRLHAQVLWRGGEYVIVDRGSNPISVNGRELGRGIDTPIRPGDELHIGGYVLRVSAASSAAPPPPASDAGMDIFASLGLGSAPPASGAAAAPSPPSTPAGAIPMDWDPFAVDPSPPAPPQWVPPPRVSPPAVAPSPPAASGSLDALFGLPSGPSSDPLAGWAPPAPPLPPSTPRPAVPPAAQPLPFAAPQSRSADAPDFLPPAGSVLSWDDPSGESHTIIRPPRSAAAAAEPPDLVLDFDEPTQLPPPPPPRPSVPAAPAPKPSAGVLMPPPVQLDHPDVAALTAALHEGLAMPSVPANAAVLSPALMRLLGSLLHEATRGTVDLLAARAALKREIRAEVTMIVSRENNPLKFSPSAEVALGHLLGPATRGFMEPQQAMRDAYDDLRAHQFGFLAGMRAALEGVLKRFDPATLEGKLTQKSMLASLLPGKRKAQMWDVFTELYGQISAEASDDFHRLFGEEFLRAYNEYVDQLARDRP